MTVRVVADGKHLSLDGRPFKVRGVTYGTFVPRLDGELFPDRSQVKKDFADIDAGGLNVVRTYTLPPADVMDLAGEMGLRLIVGLHYGDWRYEPAPGRRARRRVHDAGRRAVDEALERCSGRSEVMAIAVGNEVPGDVVRAHGIRGVENVISRLVDEVHSGDASMLATYCNFPTTEYLHIENADLACFNIFLERPEAFRAYIRRLQVVTGEVPLVVTELGLAAAIHGERAQAETLEWQLRILDECGVAGGTVFSWTDEWGVDGQPVEGWGFGITDADRNPKPALDVVERWARSHIRDLRREWPSISAIVCAYNGDQLIEKCLASLQRCDYPKLEVLVCDDGSTDRTLEIARSFPFKVLELQRGGLGAARNAGIQAAGGEIVAFVDADAFCHPEWPYHLALTLEDDNVVATGGPNLPVSEVGLVERAVATSPGGPVHVLISDDRAEHVPGCNMAFMKGALEEIGGFDPVYTAAGDDVDVCWKLLDAWRAIAFAPAAQVRHHRRDTVRGYLKQQRGYGRAERLVAEAHRHRFNRLGQARWAGFIYGGPRLLSRILRPLVYHGRQGTSPYQGVVHRRAEAARNSATALLPLIVLLGAAGAATARFWQMGAVVAVISLLAVLSYGLAVAVAATPMRGEPHPWRYRLMVGLLHLAQPLARAWGRVTGRPAGRPPYPTRPVDEWTGDREVWLSQLEERLAASGCRVRVGGPHDPWDIEVSRGIFVAYQMTVAVIWGWTPARRGRIRMRRSAVAVALAAAFTWVTWPGGHPVLLGSVVSLAALEAYLLRRSVVNAISTTTAGARS